MEHEDRHHILNFRHDWDGRLESKQLRATPTLIAKIGRKSVHEVIHRECPPVPVLGYHILKRTIREFSPTREVISTMDNLVQAMDIAADDKRTHPIERASTDLTIEAINLQRDYIAEYFESKSRTYIQMGWD